MERAKLISLEGKKVLIIAIIEFDVHREWGGEWGWVTWVLGGMEKDQSSSTDYKEGTVEN